MRILRICVLVLFILATFTFAVFFARDLSRRDTTWPVINTGDEVFELSVQDDESVLLDGVTAYDEKDGDLTDHVVIESVSGFLIPGECNVRYAVCDRNNHVATADRRIRYTDYTAPLFYLNESLCFSKLEKADLKSCVGATDVIDGDISENVIISASDYVADQPGVYHFICQTTNSKGETIEATLPVFVEERNYSAPTIKLSQYLTYIKVGEDLDYKQLVESVVNQKDEELNNVVLTYDSGLRSNQAGVYAIHYYAQAANELGEADSSQPRGHAVLIVIVEE